MEKDEKFAPRIVRLIENYFLSYTREFIQEIKQNVKQAVDEKLKLMMALCVIGLGLIFLLVGIASVMSQLFGINGVGQLIVGIVIIIIGIIVAEASKSKSHRDY